MITKEFFSVDRLMSEGKYGDFCIYYRSHQNRVSFSSEFYKTRRLSELYKQVCLFQTKKNDGMIEYLCVKISPESINAINNLSKNEPLKGYSFKNSSAWRKIHE